MTEMTPILKGRRIAAMLAALMAMAEMERKERE